MSRSSFEAVLNQHPDDLYMDVLRVSALGILVSLGGLVLHIAIGMIVFSVDTIHVSYPLLEINNDVVLNLLLALAGVFICVFNIVLVGLAVIGDTRQRTVIRLVIISAVAIGFGLSVLRFAFPVLVESLPLSLDVTTWINVFT